jgi:hypothetical protein
LPDQRVGARQEARHRELRDVLGDLEHAQQAVVALLLDRDARRGDEREPLDAVRELDRRLGRDEAAHRVADDRGGVDVEPLEQRVEPAAVARDRDLLARHRRLAEARQVHRDDAMRLHERGDVLQPVLPRAGQAVDEDERRAGADVEDVGGPALDLHPRQMVAPRDLGPVPHTLVPTRFP